MPTYKNNTSTQQRVGATTLEPGEQYENEVFLTDLPSGVDKISDLPSYNPTVKSEQQTGNTDDEVVIEIPEELNNIPVEGVKGSIYCSAGACEIKYNTIQNTPAATLAATQTHEVGVRQRLISQIRIKFTQDSSAVTINLQRS